MYNNNNNNNHNKYIFNKTPLLAGAIQRHCTNNMQYNNIPNNMSLKTI